MADLPILERHPGGFPPDLLELLYERMLLVRRFEERILGLFSEGRLHGTTHAYIGQEAVAAGVFAHLGREDVVFTNHRCHGHYLMHQDDPAGLMAEMMGREAGPCGGRGGSQHVHRGNFYSNGVQGGIVPNAVGMALAERRLGRDALAAVFLGDGTLGEGQTYEAFNLAALWRLPVLFVVEHNFWSQSTPSHLQIAGDIAARPRAFGIPTVEVASQDVRVTWSRAREAVERIRREGGPAALVFHTFRFCSHSRSDDGRPESCVVPWREHDPVGLAAGLLPAEVRAGIEARVQGRLAEAVAQAEASGYATDPVLPPLPLPLPAEVRPGSEKVVQSLNRALHELLAEDPRVLVLGEDLLDPYGGAFKVTRGLSTAFPDRVLPTPISEAAITGVASGMALRGLRPILEIMFGDFLTLCVDQLLNYVSKFRGMYGGATCPLVVRTPMGGRRGYGPTHSQTLERLLLGVPDLRIVAPSVLHDPGALLREAVADDAPVLFVENKLLYTRPRRSPDSEGWIGPWRVRDSGGAYPTVGLSPVDFRPARAVLATYGGMVEIAMEAAERLLVEHEIACEIAVPSLLQPLPLGALREPLRRAGGRLVTVEEGIGVGGWGAEVIAACASEGLLRVPPGRVAAPSAVIPSAEPLEVGVLPGVEAVMAEVLRRVS